VAAHVEEEIFPLPTPFATLPLVQEVKGTVIVSSLLGIREGGYFDAYLAKLPRGYQSMIPQVVAGEWVPIELAMVHYRTCDSLGLPPAEIVRMGGLMAQRLNSNAVALLLKLAKTSGVTPWTALGQLQRVFEGSFRGGGGTRVFKLGPKEARVELVAFPIVGIPWSRYGWRGTLATNMERFCDRCFATELRATSTSVSYRLAWV
jgi:hypothetical protein